MYLRIRIRIDGEEEDKISGIPMTIVNDPAKEKLSTVVVDMTVDAKQRLRPFRTTDVEAVSEVVGRGTARKRQGIAVRTMNRTGDKA